MQLEWEAFVNVNKSCEATEQFCTVKFYWIFVDHCSYCMFSVHRYSSRKRFCCQVSLGLSRGFFLYAIRYMDSPGFRCSTQFFNNLTTECFFFWEAFHKDCLSWGTLLSYILCCHLSLLWFNHHNIYQLELAHSLWVPHGLSNWDSLN